MNDSLLFELASKNFIDDESSSAINSILFKFKKIVDTILKKNKKQINVKSLSFIITRFKKNMINKNTHDKFEKKNSFSNNTEKVISSNKFNKIVFSNDAD